MSEPIQGTPEGRAGIWRITNETAAALIEATPGEEIHNLLGSGGPFFCGANWTKAQALEHTRVSGLRWGLVFPPNTTIKHQLVALNDEKRWSFDVGEIEESRMKGEPTMTFEPVLPDETEALCAAVPPGILASLRRYATERVPVGDFLTAVLSNDLMDAFGRADIENTASLREICQYVYNALPRNSHGSPQAVEAWLAGPHGGTV